MQILPEETTSPEAEMGGGLSGFSFFLATLSPPRFLYAICNV
jgi:hypothetical protein